MSVENELLTIRFYRTTTVRSSRPSCAAGNYRRAALSRKPHGGCSEMYRGRPPPRGGYLLPFQGRDSRSYPSPSYRDDRTRPRPPYHHDYHDHGHTDPYSRSPPRKRYSSPGSGSHRRGEHWAGELPRQVSDPGSVQAEFMSCVSEHSGLRSVSDPGQPREVRGNVSPDVWPDQTRAARGSSRSVDQYLIITTVTIRDQLL